MLLQPHLPNCYILVIVKAVRELSTLLALNQVFAEECESRLITPLTPQLATSISQVVG